MHELTLFTVATLLWSVLLAGTNYLVDPIQNYRRDAAPVFSKSMRYQIPGIIRHYEFDTIMIGTSHSANFIPNNLDALTGSRSVNLSANASSGWEQSTIVELALKTRDINTVIWEMNYRTVHIDASKRVESGEFPLHLYERSVDSHFRYLYSLDTLWQSVKRLRKIGHRDIGTINAWAEKYADRFDGQHAKDHFCAKQNFRYSNQLPNYSKVLDKTILPLVRNNAGVQFKFFLPPLSFYNFLLPNELRRYYAFRRSLYSALTGLPNVEVFDFTSRVDWIGNPLNYKDVEHYRPQISYEMLRSMARQGETLNPASLPLNERKLKQFLMEKMEQEPPCS